MKNNYLSKKTTIDYLSIAPINTNNIHVATAVTHQDKNQKVTVLVIRIAVDKEKTGNGICDIPVYMSGSLWRNQEHLEMVRIFNKGEIFVPIEIKNLVVYESFDSRGNKKYWGKADGFRTLSSEEADRRLAELI